MRTLTQDLRYGFRVLAKNPAFTAIALVTLMLGIGATAAMFSVVHAVLLRPLPYRDANRLVSIYEDASKIGFAHNTSAPGNFFEWKKETAIFEGLADYQTQSFNLSAHAGEPEKLDGIATTYNMFSILGVQPLLGRTFTPQEDWAGAPHVALISYRLWKGRFGGEKDIVGRGIFLNNKKYTVIGIMPAGFVFPRKDTEIWTPIEFEPKELSDFGNHYLVVIGRLRPGISIQEANAELLILTKRMAREHPDDEAFITRFFAEPLQNSYTRDVHRGLLVLMIAVGLILLIACANVANLLLSRASGRQREIAIRTAVGANRGRVMRQLLTESGLLGFGGGLLGILLAVWTFKFLKNLIPADLSTTVSLTLDLQVLGFAVLVTLSSGILFGLAPALQISKADLNDMLKEGARGSTGSRRTWLRNALVVGEVALSLMLLIGSGLLLESFANLRGINPGFDPNDVLTMRIIVPDSRYSDFVKRTEFFERVLEGVRRLPGVKAAGFTSALPLTWEGGTNSFAPEGIALRHGETYDANNRVVTPGYFEAMRIPLRRGRLFENSDGKDAPLVAIINETMARKFWPNQDPVGKRFKRGSLEDKTPWVRIVGIVADVRQMRLNRPARQEMYFPYWQANGNWMVPRDLVIRVSGDPMSLASAVRHVVWSIDPNQPVSNVMTINDLLDEEVASRRVQTLLLGGLAALALILACVGIYGVLSYLITQRTQEIGVRVALGADAGRVFRTIAGQGLSLAAAGIATGILATLGLARLLRSLLFGVSASDPLTYVAAVVTFAAVAILACGIPARKAANVDPLVALRYE